MASREESQNKTEETTDEKNWTSESMCKPTEFQEGKHPDYPGITNTCVGAQSVQEEVAIQVHVWEKRKLRTSELAAFDLKYPWVPSLTVDRPRSRRPPPVSKPIHRHLKGIDDQDSLPSF